jgi:hypothetical protein
MGGLAHDIVSLLELQTKLFVADCKESISRIVIAVGSLIAALLIFAGSIPLILSAFAQLLIVLGMPIGWALLVSAILGIFLAIGMGALAWWSIRQAGRVFLRSGREFTRNLGWLKESLKPTDNSRDEEETFEAR